MSKQHPSIVDDQIESVCVFGDWHGNPTFAQHALAEIRAEKPDAYLHVGDFGIWPAESDLDDPTSFLSIIEAELADQQRELWFIDGNHEHFDLLETFPYDDRGLQEISPHVFHIPRGHSWTWGDKSFVGLGGAPSIDKMSRHEYISWFSQEEITQDDVNDALIVESADVLITHDAPPEYRPAMQAIRFPPEIEQANERSARNIRTVIEALKPSVLVHGHYHEPHVTEHAGVTSVGLGADLGLTEPNRFIFSTTQN